MESAARQSGGISAAARRAARLLLLLVLSSSLAIPVRGGVRRFTFLYEANTSAAQSLEFENWITWRRGSGFDQVDFRHELEYGLTDRFQASIYLADWFYTDDQEQRGFVYSDTAVELIYNLTNPVVDPVGMSIYGELRAGDQLIELESKMIAQKNFGPLILAYNATLEAVWEGSELEEREGELSQALGMSYEISPPVSAGIELVHEFVFPEWKDAEKIRNLFVGPNVSYRRGSWFITATALAQATDTDDEPDFQLRTIVGTGF